MLQVYGQDSYKSEHGPVGSSCENINKNYASTGSD
jgi:hypothetical protein